MDIKRNMWAWYDIVNGTFSHLYSKRICVEICFPDGGKRAEAAGIGKIVQVTVAMNDPMRINARIRIKVRGYKNWRTVFTSTEKVTKSWAKAFAKVCYGTNQYRLWVRK